MPEIWDEDILGPQPAKCAACDRGACSNHDPFFTANLGKVVYGLFNCECLCDESNVEAAVGAP